VAEGTAIRPVAAGAAPRTRGTRGRLVRGACAAWDRFWFGEAALVRLALFRIVMICAAFDGVWKVRPAVMQHAADVRTSYLARGWDPIYAFELLGLGPPGASSGALWIALVVAIALGIVGLFTRLACAVVALLTFYWIGSEYSFGKPHHDAIALMFGLLALPLAPVGSRLSLDSLLRRRQGVCPERAPWAALPLRVTQLTIAIGYFFSGATKLAVSGLAWANGYTLMAIMAENRSPWSEYFLEHRGLLVLMSLVLLLGQTGFPLVLVSTGLRWLFVPLLVLFHFMAMKTMATGTFLTLTLTLSAFVALERVPEVVARSTRTGPWWRRLLAMGAFAAFSWWLAALYCANKPEWFPWLLAPAAAALVASVARFDLRSVSRRAAAAA
jgi:hypothetical protein